MADEATSSRGEDDRVVILGASGFLGMNLVRALQDRGVDPICTYRGRVPRVSLRRTGVETVFGDLDDRESLVEGLEGADLVYHFAGHYPDLSIDREATMELGMGQLENALEACADAGVGRMVFLSSVASVAPTDEGPSTEEHTFDEEPGFGVYHDLKWRMEQTVGDESRFETTILVPGACIGPHDMRIGTSAMLVGIARGQRVEHADGWINICDARDVADFAIEIAALDEPPPRVLLAGSNHRLHEFLEMLAERYDASPPPAPLDDDEAVARADEEELRAAEEGCRAEISRELVDLAIHGNRIDASLSRQLTGLDYRDLEDTLSSYEAWARRVRILPRETSKKREVVR